MKLFRTVSILSGMTAAVVLASCSNSTTTPTSTAVLEAPGAGDRSGSSIANARSLTKAASTTFTIPCSGKVYVGPFKFTKDPQTLTIQVSVKGTSTNQVCLGGNWVDQSDARPAIAGLPCVESTSPTSWKLEYEYSPGNGGNDVSPLYWAGERGAPAESGCDTAEVTLSL